MSHFNSRYNDSPDAWPLTSSCGGGCGGSVPRIGTPPMPQRFDESWQPDYVPKATVAPRTAMPRYFPDEQPDAVMPRHGVQRPVPSRSYDDYPDSPHFYTPRSPMMMQPPGIQHPGTTRPWDDGPDTDNFYRQASHSPQIKQAITARPWDDGPDTDNFYRQANGGPSVRQVITARPWDDGPDTDNFYKQASPARITRPESLSRPWDDGPDTDNFYKQISPNIRAKQAITSRPWDDGPDTDNFYRQTPVSLPGYPVQQVVERYFQPDHVATPLAKTKFFRFSPEEHGNPDALPPTSGTPFNIPPSSWYAGKCSSSPPPLEERTSSAMQPFPLAHFYQDPYLQSGAFYGRSVANLGGCSGWNSGGPYLITAGHCDPTVRFKGKVIDPASRKIQLEFGRYGRTWGDINQPTVPNPVGPIQLPQGYLDLLERLEQLGIPASRIISVNEVSYRTIPDLLIALCSYDCHFLSTSLKTSHALPPEEKIEDKQCNQEKPESYDVSYYTCEPKKITFYPSPFSSQVETTYILPVHLFGHIPLEISRQNQQPAIKKDSPVYLMGYGESTWLGSNRHVFLSPGRFIASHPAAVDPFYCRGPKMSTTTYGHGGVSGGVTMIPNDPIYSGTPYHRSPAVSVGGNGLVSTYLPEKARGYTEKSVPTVFDPYFSSPSVFVPVQIGSHVGIKRFLSCPQGFAVAGLVGSGVESSLDPTSNTTKEQRKANAPYLGNLGLVCVPYQPASGYAVAFSKAGVVASGSLDVAVYDPPQYTIDGPITLDLRVVESDPIPFDVYMNEYLSTYLTSMRTRRCDDKLYFHRSFQQDLAMCPPGYYITSIWFGMDSSGVNFANVRSFWCRSWDGSHTFRRDSSIGGAATSQSKSQVVYCSPESILTGMNVTSSYRLHSVQGIHCQKARSGP